MNAESDEVCLRSRVSLKCLSYLFITMCLHIFNILCTTSCLMILYLNRKTVIYRKEYRLRLPELAFSLTAWKEILLDRNSEYLNLIAIRESSRITRWKLYRSHYCRQNIDDNYTFGAAQHFDFTAANHFKKSLILGHHSDPPTGVSKQFAAKRELFSSENAVWNKQECSKILSSISRTTWCHSRIKLFPRS